jgi:amino acid transporter
LADSGKSHVSFAPTDASWKTIFSLPFAGSLVYVMFAYSGWNSSSYIVGNMENPKKNLPFSLVVGTAIVTLVYLALTGVFMYVCTFDEMRGKVAIGNIVIGKVFGDQAALAFAGLFAIALVSGINAMFIAGPRVAQRMGEDYRIFSFLRGQNEKGAPVNAILLQTLISVCIVLLFDFRMILQYIELTLSLFCLLTVIGVFVIRARKLGDETSIKTWGYPFTPLLFIGVTLWMIFYFVQMEPMRLVWTLVTILFGLGIYFLRNYSRKLYIEAFKNSFNLKGRTNRYEYWSFFIANIYLTMLGFVLFISINKLISNLENVNLYHLIVSIFIILFYLSLLIIQIPLIALSVRRMHDHGKSGWYVFVPVFSLILSLQKGDLKRNIYGDTLQLKD